MRALTICLLLGLSYFNGFTQVCEAYLFDFSLQYEGEILQREEIECWGIYELTFCRCGPAFDSTENQKNTATQFSIVQCHLPPSSESVFPLKLKIQNQEMTLLIKFFHDGVKDDCKDLNHGEACRYELGPISFQEGMYLYTLDKQRGISSKSELSLEKYYDLLNKDYEYKNISENKDSENWDLITRWWK